ncbi:SMI1/KNR4 family protein [Pseudomarimonas arenosa]|uniref:SMI1/KNR4 family protein n=1 Tax=Pseudomarimonas arenosa TaxID=2774145 RepID=A0AAW3ZP03_9GAMM|nr:SMI1/KNR4 family protein [Pseudomarimonas arenosa]MBD8526817.1 SMI1/KNR4 family protein [Pseudomarimonas arenosa]
MIRIKQATCEADKERLWEYHWPRVAASEVALIEVERHLGFELDPGYRNFLAVADGWPSFFQGVNLFGTPELLGGPAMLAANEILDAAEPYLEVQCGIGRPSAFPIAASARDKDVFFMQLQGSALQPPLVWWAGEEVDRFASFSDFFASMVEYNKLELKALSR